MFVVHHDPAIAEQPIQRTAYSALRTVRLPNGEPLPTLAGALDAIGDAAQVFMEVKALDPGLDGALLLALDRGPAPSNYHVHSFDHRIVKRLKTKRGSLSSGVLSASYVMEPAAQLAQTGAGVLWQHESLVDRELVDAIHGAKGRVFAWTVDDPARIEELAHLGADAVCTNRPDVARGVLR